MFVSDKIALTDLKVIVPKGFVLVEQHASGDPKSIYPEELALVSNAIEKRQIEFASGRSCAKKALSILGISDFPLLATPNRAPIWPTGIVGSITHTEGYCAAVAGSSSDCAAVGIDAEVVGRIDKEFWALLFTEEEQRLINDTSPRNQDVLTTVIFGAKESFFKCQFPITGKWLDFLDVTVTISNELVFVRVQEQEGSSLCCGRGKYCYREDDNLVITLITGLPSLLY
jgi:4'-phosphopantetheinyl transferase EntD